MKLESLRVCRYRSLRDVEISLEDLNVFIGPNASGKSTILDALRFLHEAVLARDFSQPVAARGGIIHLAWKGEDADRIEFELRFSDDANTYEWKIVLRRREYYLFSVREDVRQITPSGAPLHLLDAEDGEGFWWSGKKGERVPLKESPTACAIAAAAADASFPARNTAEFVRGWGFFDPSPFSLRRGWPSVDSEKLDAYGRNLAERLYRLSECSAERFNYIITATQSVLGLPSEVSFRAPRAEGRSEEEAADRATDDRVFFLLREPGLKYAVHQIGASSGTLRILALMTALFGEMDSSLVGIEEPENHVHPRALEAFAEYLLKARSRVQILVTTHSPILLDALNDPRAVCVVSRSDKEGTKVVRERNPEAVRRALRETGFGLGEFYQTKGFGDRAA